MCLLSRLQSKLSEVHRRAERSHQAPTSGESQPRELANDARSKSLIGCNEEEEGCAQMLFNYPAVGSELHVCGITKWVLIKNK